MLGVSDKSQADLATVENMIKVYSEVLLTVSTMRAIGIDIESIDATVQIDDDQWEEF